MCRRTGLPTEARSRFSRRTGLPTEARSRFSRAEVGGEAGIRTLDTAFGPYNGLANRRLQPLGHLTVMVVRRWSPVVGRHRSTALDCRSSINDYRRTTIGPTTIDERLSTNDQRLSTNDQRLSTND